MIFLITGSDVYKQLKFESGVHRVQRVPVTEANGRIHTSTVTVAVLPEAEEVDVEIDPQDLDDVARIRTTIQGSEGLVRFLSHYFMKSEWGRGLEREAAAAEVVHLAHRAPADLRPMLEQCIGLGEHLPDVLGGKQ